MPNTRIQKTTVEGDSSNNYQIFSGSALKLIAIISMFIDHFAYIILPHFSWAIESFTVAGRTLTIYYLIRKIIGRLAFPLFCFLITEGYIHTRNRKKYAGSLLLFSIISEIPFDYAFYGKLFYWEKQNVFFTLLLGFILIHVIDSLNTKVKKLPQVLIIFGIFVAAKLLKADYGFNGVIVMGIMYALREQKILQALFCLPALSGGITAFCAFFPINMYNGKRGFIKGKAAKYLFYLFYPLHMVILKLVAKAIWG